MPRNNIMAVFRDLASARRAITALGRVAIDANSISLTGPAADAASAEPDTSELDKLIAQFQANRVAVGATAGGLIGAGLGLFVALAALKMLGGNVSFGAIVATMLFGAIGMSAMGGFVTGMYNLQPAETSEPAPDDSPGPAIVGVHSEKKEDIELAADVMGDQRPVEVYLTDRRGRRM